jgi:hypothetical protein
MTYNFCFIHFSQDKTVEAAEAGKKMFRAPLTQGAGYGVATQLQIFPVLRSITMPNLIEVQWFGFLKHI